MANRSDGKVVISTALDNSGLSKGLGQIKGTLGGLNGVVKKLGGVITAAFSVKVIADFAKECLDLGSDLQEVQNVVDVTFTTMNEQVNEFAKNAAKSAGLSETMAKKYVGTFGAMAKSFKFTEAEAYEMSTALTQMSGDVASFYNLSQDEAYTKLKSVFTGETESLKDLGVVMTQTALDDYALRNGLGKTTSQMSEQEKVALRYRFVLDQLSAASGDFVRTQDSWANQTRILSLQFDQFKATIGQGLINALTPAIKIINQLIGKLQEAAEVFREFTVALFGDAGSAESSIGAITDSAKDMGEATAEAAKQAKKALAPFDEITKLNASESGSASTEISSSNSTATSTGGQLENVSNKVAEFVSNIQALLAPLQDISFFNLKSSLEGLGESFKSIGAVIVDSLKWAYENILVPLAGWCIEDFVPAGVEAFAAAFDLLAAALTPVWEGIKKLWGYLTPAFQWIGDTAVWILGQFQDAFSDLAKTFLQKGTEVEGIISGIGEIFAVVWSGIQPLLDLWKTYFASIFGSIKKSIVTKINGILDVLKGLVDFVAGVFTGDWERAWGGLKKIAAGYWKYLKDTATNVLNSIKSKFSAVKEFFVSAWAAIKKAASTAWSGIKTAFSAAKTWFADNVTGPIKTKFSGLWSKLKSGAKDAWSGVKSVFSSVATFFKETFTKAWNGVVSVFSSGGTIFTNIKDGVLAGFKKVVNSLIDGLNKVIATPFNGINTALEAIKSINILGAKPFSGIKTITVPKIPYLAQCAVIPPNAPFMAVLGDQRHGTNIEAPLETIQEAVALVMEDMTGGMMAGFEATVAVLKDILQAVYGIEIGDDVIGKAVARYNSKMAVVRGG